MRKDSLFDRLKSVITPKKEDLVQTPVQRTQEPFRQNTSAPNYPWPILSTEASNYIKGISASDYESSRKVLIIDEPHEYRDGQQNLYKFLNSLYRDNPDLIRRSVFLSEGYPANERLSLQPLIEAEPNPSDELISDVLNSYLITGYMAYEWKKQTGISIIGTEDKDIYDLRLNSKDWNWGDGLCRIIDGHICVMDWRKRWVPAALYSTRSSDYDKFLELEKKLLKGKGLDSRKDPNKVGRIALVDKEKALVLVSEQELDGAFVVARNKSIAGTLIEKAKNYNVFPILFVGAFHLNNFDERADAIFDTIKLYYAAQRAMRINDLSMYSENASPFARINPERFLDFESKGIAEYLKIEKIGFVVLSTVDKEKPNESGRDVESYQKLFDAQLTGNYKDYVEWIVSNLRVRRNVATVVRPNPEAAAWFVKALKAIKGDIRPPFVGIGDPRSDAKFYKKQHGETCAIVAQEEIIHKLTGKDLGENTLKQKAIERGWYEEEQGTYDKNLGKLLELNGIPIEQRWGATIDDLKREIEQGNKVIVGVDAGLLWYNKKYEDKGHAVWVTALRIDPKDGRIVSVAMNDSGNEKIDGGGEIPVDRFIRAWEKFEGVMVATRFHKK